MSDIVAKRLFVHTYSLNCCVIHELLFFYIIYYLILQSQFDALYSIEAAVNMCRCRTEKKETAI